MSEQLALFIDFENIAIWAEDEFFELKLSPLMDFLQSRGPVVIKRAYADWPRFPRYRDEMLNNSIDLYQLYNIRSGKNRGDIQLAVDAFETALTHVHIDTIVIVSGDSDFGPLASKLRQYGQYVLGIGPRAITHKLLSRSCDEFVYLEDIIGSNDADAKDYEAERKEARKLLKKALSGYEHRGELPVLATRLKQTMLNMEPTFNETKIGYKQFRQMLEDFKDIVKILFKDMDILVAPTDFVLPDEQQAKTTELSSDEKLQAEEIIPEASLEKNYQQVFDRVVATDTNSRREILKDIFNELSNPSDLWTPDSLLDTFYERYNDMELDRPRSMLLKIWQLGFRQEAYYYTGAATFHTPVNLSEDIKDIEEFIRRAESDYVYAVVRAGMPIDIPLLAAVLYDDESLTNNIENLLQDLLRRRQIIQKSDSQYLLATSEKLSFKDNPHLEKVISDIHSVDVGDDLPRDFQTAHGFAEKGTLERSRSFSSAAQNYLVACVLQWEAINNKDVDASLDDLRWYIASYASAKAAELSHENCYDEARPYYLAFFSLVQEDDPLWDRMRGLVNPMLRHYWLNIGRELDIPLNQHASPANIAVEAATHPDPKCRGKWQAVTEELAQVNPSLVLRFAEQVRRLQDEIPDSPSVAAQIERILGETITQEAGLYTPDAKPSEKEEQEETPADPTRIPLADDPGLQVLVKDINKLTLDPDLLIEAETARQLAELGISLQEVDDYPDAASYYLNACCVQWEAISRCKAQATLGDLRWYMVLYAIAKAILLKKHKNFQEARAYQLAFFTLAQPDDRMWHWLAGKVDSVLLDFWQGVAQEYDVQLNQPQKPVDAANQIITHDDIRLRDRWHEITNQLALRNPKLLRRLVKFLKQKNAAGNAQLIDEIEKCTRVDSKSLWGKLDL